jgi:hypothetical protein
MSCFVARVEEEIREFKAIFGMRAGLQDQN